MKRKILIADALLLTWALAGACGAVTVQTNETSAVMENGRVSVTFALKAGSYSVVDLKTRETVLKDAGVNTILHPGVSFEVDRCEAVSDELGRGQRLVLKVNDPGYRVEGHHPHSYLQPSRIYSYTLYEDCGAVVMGFGIRMPKYYRMRLMDAAPMARAKLFPGKTLTGVQSLNGAAGAEPASVQAMNEITRCSANSLMVTCLVDGRRRTVVWGGLKNREFGKYCSVIGGEMELKADDPSGRLIDPETEYVADDTFYLDVTTDDPFSSLEQYGRAMRAANHANPQVYDFPVQCAWGVGALCNLGNVNNSAKIIEQIEAAQKCGITRYVKVGIQLVPDKYHGDTEQGWWDDEHFVRYGHLRAPYETLAKWGEAMTARGGYPCMYVQTGMPSDDFARAFPQYMLFNDISGLERKHMHHQPFVSFDYTDPGFKRHMQNVWACFREAGIRSVMFDYPETGWRPEGGFDDRYVTTASAYREIFRQARDGLGPDARLDERLLGESGRPCLEMTAGLVDVQRNWSDSKDYSGGMVTISGLRWYKNRTVYNYYPDTKSLHDLSPEVRQSMLTMMFLTSGRLNIGTSFQLFTPEITHDVSRIYPPNRENYAARPLDAFVKGRQDPMTYDLALTTDWHQVALFNPTRSELTVRLPLSGDSVTSGAVGLSPQSEYYVHDFWSDSLLGKFKGDAAIEQKLQPLCCKMLSIRAVQSNPQVVSTSRHILQGWVDLGDVKWDAGARQLSGTAMAVAGEPFRIALALNGFKVKSASSSRKSAVLKIEPHGEVAGLATVTIVTPESEAVSPVELKATDWLVVFE